MLDHIIPYIRRRRRGQGDGLWIPQPLTELTEASVVVPEVMSPFADTVCFVDSQQLDVRFLGRFYKVLAAKAFRGDVDQVIFAGTQSIQPPHLLAGNEAAVNIVRPKALFLQRVDLILHQRDQGRDDQRNPVARDRRQLVTKTFAAARRHDAKTILAREDGFQDFTLSGTKFGQAEPVQK